MKSNQRTLTDGRVITLKPGKEYGVVTGRRATRPCSIVLMDNPAREESEAYSTHIACNDETGGRSSGRYDMSSTQAWLDFQKRVNDAFEYVPGTWENSKVPQGWDYAG